MAQTVKFNKSLTYSAAMTASATNTGTIYFPTDSNAIILNGKVVGQQNTVTSVAGRTGAVTLTKTDVGLSNVDNTADSSKSVKNSQYAQKIGTDSAHPQVGGAKQPVYVSSDGTITAGTALGDAAYKGVDNYASMTGSSTNLPTTGAVVSYVQEKIKDFGKASQAMHLVATFSASTKKITSIAAPDLVGEYLQVGDTYNITDLDPELMEISGWLFVCDAAGTVDGNTFEAGDSVLYTGRADEGETSDVPQYVVLQTNVEDATTSKSGVVRVVNAASTSTTANDVYNVTGANAKIAAVVANLKASFSGSASKTVTAVSETNGVISVTFGDISIKKSQVSDFPSAMTPTTATSTVLGGAKLGSDTVQTVAANAASATASRTYAIQVNSSGQLVVNIPWTDTTYDSQISTINTSITNLGTRVTAVETALTWE